ncbi:hypothetical protein DDE18_09710 [Nocardioides gansuensis]|uniref:Spore protein YkvP/CgeB glycosyl transferase-like domain-containing protein n=1 Tax=Nocardioides gansuensis TaxID=2138300 RepID=A0A2T8FA96_9ACTN|nr:glycosyltransferase [Nocardioides gansuensis]PVG82642.1 hypothetical protein DDE18_09710 [Nocardioides gansuensis]
MTPGESAERADAGRRRAAYRRLVEGELAVGDRGTVIFLVRSVDLREARFDLVAAAGLGLALVEQGYGVRLVPQHRWHLGGAADVWVALLPEVDPSLAPAGAWRVAWALNDTEQWAAADHLVAYDQVLATSDIALTRLREHTDRAGTVLRAAADARIFTPGVQGQPREGVVSFGIHVDRTRTPHPVLGELAVQVPLTVHAEPMRNMRAGLLARLAPPVPWLRVPEVAARALVTVDDMSPSAVGNGTLDARVFESLACGTLPVVNTRLGLAEIGLDLPTYRSTRELARVLSHLVSDPEGTQARAATLRETVLAGHTWEHRAEEFASAVKRAREAASPGPRRALHYFPDYNSANPYQGMLFAGLDTVDAYPVAVTDVIDHLDRRAVSAVPGTLNIHWTTPILQYATGPFRAALELDRFSAALHRFRGAGGRLVWTLHNVLPHEARLVWAETELAQLLADRADAIHALSAITARQASEVLRLDPRRVVVIEHSSYLGCYPDWISRDAARRSLGLGSDDVVLVALGGIRPYKGLGRLLDVFHELAEDDPRLRLLVAGKPAQTSETAGLQRRCEQSQRVISHFAHLPDDQLQVWFRAGDLAVLPYSRILNSGVFWLAQSFGLPIVGPRTGALLDLADQDHVRLFSPRDDRSLKETLRTAIVELVYDETQARAARQASLETARSRPPEQMAEDFAAFIDALLPASPHQVTGAGAAR